jgi:deoxyguanosine kinase
MYSRMLACTRSVHKLMYATRTIADSAHHTRSPRSPTLPSRAESAAPKKFRCRTPSTEGCGRQETSMETNASDGRTPKRLFCVEGPIGVGKTTLISNLQSSAPEGVVVLFEPVEEWTRTVVDATTGENLLDAMYKGTVSSAVFQLAILQSRFGRLVKALCDPTVHTVISERGPWSEKYVFAKSNLSDVDFEVYKYTQNAMMEHLFDLVGPISVTFMYLTLDTPRALDRIRSRGRPEEAGLEEAYMQTLEHAHQNMEQELRRDGVSLKHLVGLATHVHLDASNSEAWIHDSAYKRIHGNEPVAKVVELE